MYKSIEYKQHEVLKYLLTQFKQSSNDSYNLLHIALKPKPLSKSSDHLDLSLFKVILKYDKSADHNSQDTYGNTPVHLAT